MEWWRLKVRNRKAARVFKGGVMWLLLAGLFVVLPGLVVALLSFQRIHSFVRRACQRRVVSGLVAFASLVAMGIGAKLIFELFFLRYTEQTLFATWLEYAVLVTGIWLTFEVLVASLDRLYLDRHAELEEWFG